MLPPEQSVFFNSIDLFCYKKYFLRKNMHKVFLWATLLSLQNMDQGHVINFINVNIEKIYTWFM